MRIYPVLSAVLALAAPLVSAGPAPVWTHVPIFAEAPLEAKIGTFGMGNDPDLLAMVLWNDGASNRLDAIRVPPPYDGSGITSTPLENTNTLFALGDICTIGTSVVVPYIKNFNIEVARYNGSSWSTSTVPGTTANNFTTADCAKTPNAIVVSGQDFNDQEVEFFKSTTAGASYTFYGRYNTAVGPFSGAPRDQLVSSRSGPRLFSLHMTPTGLMRVGEFNIDDSPASFTQRNVVSLPAPPGSFTVVRESAGGIGLNGRVFFTYNADNNARTVDFPVSDGSDIHARILGTINNMGSQFPFQGGGVVYTDGEPSNANILWGDWFRLEDNGTSSIDPTYPKVGVGGPVDACAVHYDSGRRRTALVVPEVGSKGTVLLFHEEALSGIFADGFESGDTSAWTCD